MKQNLLTDIELDVQELKCLVDTVSKENDQRLREVAKRSIVQMKIHLDVLYRELDFSIPLSKEKIAQPAVVLSDTLLTDFSHSISLNDSFRFTRELFGGNGDKLSEAIKKIDGLHSFDEAMAYIKSVVQLNEDNEAAADFIELLKRRFI
ncbi:MAG: hypothetical protein RR319_06985 [Bacteroides sp.]